MWWLYKAQFSEPETTGKTEVAGSVEYQTPSLEAVCDRRIYDKKLGMVVDTDDEAIPESVIKEWFNQVYEASATQAEA